MQQYGPSTVDPLTRNDRSASSSNSLKWRATAARSVWSSTAMTVSDTSLTTSPLSISQAEKPDGANGTTTSRIPISRAGHRGTCLHPARARGRQPVSTSSSSRYERPSLIFTSNKKFGRWAEVFGDDTVAAAMIDRLVHHADVIALEGDFNRLEDHPRGHGRQQVANRMSPFSTVAKGSISAVVDTRRRTARALISVRTFRAIAYAILGHLHVARRGRTLITKEGSSRRACAHRNPVDVPRSRPGSC